MKTKFRSIVQVLIVVAIAVLFIAWWKQQSDLARIRRDYVRLQEQNEGLRRNLTQAHAETERPAAVPAQMQPQVPEKGGAQKPRPDAASLQPAAHPPVPAPELNSLALAGTEVQPIAGGLVTTMRFTPRKTGALGLVAMAIRMPRNANARILDLAPVGPATYSDDSKTVSEDGKFAFFQGTLGEETNVQFALSVSGPVTADVRGSRGIGTFQLEIQPTGANVHGK